MKNILLTFLATFMLMSCLSPIEGDETLGSAFPEKDLDIDVHTITPGSNKIVMINNTKGVGTFWDYIIGKSTRANDTILIPFLGTQTITFTGLSGGEPVVTTRDVEVERIDFPLDEMWSLLAGDDPAGKTWVWATGNPYPNWAGVPGLFGNGGDYDDIPAWWVVSAEEMNTWGCLYDEMTFDLNKGANFTLVQKGENGTAAPTTVKDKFILDTSKKTIKTANNTPFLMSQDYCPPPYTIAKLTEDELTLIVPLPGENYIWMFKRKGYEYPKE